MRTGAIWSLLAGWTPLSGFDTTQASSRPVLGYVVFVAFHPTSIHINAARE
jgi:hypothetical protein